MAKATTRKCRQCQKAIPAESVIRIGSFNYCEECGAQRHIEAESYRELIDYICRLFGLDAPSMLILSQIKRYKEEDGFTYQGMKACLEYFFELQGHDINHSKGVGIIPYIYEETKDFYAKKKRVKDQLQASKWDGTGHSNIVTIQRVEPTPPVVELFDINEIGGDDNE